jgi:hypothetical protein
MPSRAGGVVEAALDQRFGLLLATAQGGEADLAVGAMVLPVDSVTARVSSARTPRRRQVTGEQLHDAAGVEGQGERAERARAAGRPPGACG